MNELRRIYNEGEMKGYINEGRRIYNEGEMEGKMNEGRSIEGRRIGRL